MLSSITPLGERGRGARFPVTAGAYLLGSTVGGMMAGLVVGALGRLLPGPLRLPLALAVVVAGLAADVRSARLPGWRRQVDETWLTRYRGWVYGGGFGLQLGTGVVTIVTTSLVWATWALALAAGSVVAGLVVGAAFGLTRALPLLLFRDVWDAGRLSELMARLAAARPVAERTARATSVLAAGVLVAVLAR